MKMNVFVLEEEGGIELPNGEQTEYRWVTRVEEMEGRVARFGYGYGAPAWMRHIVPVSEEQA